MESLAARVRPLILQDDPVHYAYVLKALGTYLSRHGHLEQARWCRELRKDWQSVDLASGEAGYHLSSTKVGSEEDPIEITDLGLAGTWFYGDLVHADSEQLDRGKAFEIEQRYGAAAVRVAQLAILTRETLAWIRFLVEEGLIEISAVALDGIPVKVEPKEVQLTGLYSAPAGTAAPGAAGASLSEDWKTALPGTEDGRWIMRIPWGRNE